MRGWSLVLLLCMIGAMGVAFAQPVPLPPAPAGVQVTHEQGYEFVTIHAPGVTLTPLIPTFVSPTQGGSANYAFRISRTETTNGQWVEFLTAYSRWFTIDTTFNPRAVLGRWIGATGDPNQPFATDPSMHNAAMQMTWRFAAIYCNWLHNDRADNPQAFLNGAYNTSTFGQAQYPDGTFYYTDQFAHNPGARFWIPTFDELITATHWDPDRFGPGQGGWWNYNNRSNTAPVFGPNGTGDANGDYYPNYYYNIVGQYPQSMTPWGLLDASGGVSEYTETPFVRMENNHLVAQGVMVQGSTARGSNGSPDWIGMQWYVALDSYDNYHGIRIAAAIPSPTYVSLFVISVSVYSKKRRRQ